MTAPASKLLQPITVGPLELKNRIMFPPLTTGYATRSLPRRYGRRFPTLLP